MQPESAHTIFFYNYPIQKLPTKTLWYYDHYMWFKHAWQVTSNPEYEQK